MKAVEKGLKGDAAAQTKALLAEKQPLEVVDEALIPALDIVGAKYEKGTLFLPQLLQAASAAQSAFEEIKNVIAQKGEGSARPHRAGHRQGRRARHRQEHRQGDSGELRL